MTALFANARDITACVANGTRSAVLKISSSMSGEWPWSLWIFVLAGRSL